MSDTRTQHVTLELERDYRFRATFEDVAGKPTMLFDEPEPLGAGSAPNAAAVLGAAVANCLSASLVFCLRRARVEVDGLTARVATRVSRNEHGRYRVEAIDVELDPAVADAAKLVRCEQLFEDFCLVTASVRQGIPVRVSMRRAAERVA